MIRKTLRQSSERRAQSTNMEPVCRVCLEHFKERPQSADEPQLLSMINECFNLKVNESDIPAKNICECCVSDVRAAYRFKRNYQQNIILNESRLDDFIASLEAENWELVSDFVKKEKEDISDEASNAESETQKAKADDSIASEAQSRSISAIKKTYSCHFCGKEFRKKPFLDAHLRVHTGERPFKCPHCPKAFTQSSSRNTHLRVHTGERKFKCTHCPKDFTRRHNLQSHVARHEARKGTNTLTYLQKSE